MLVIAEIGVNWNDNRAMARRMIHLAAHAGADIAKFQVYSATDLFGPGGLRPHPELHKRMLWMDGVTWHDVQLWARWCAEDGIEFMASAFDEERLRWVQAQDVRRHKLASLSVRYQPEYCRRVLGLWKETFASLGMWQQPTPFTDETRFPFPPKRYPNVRYLYCVSQYPAPLSALHFPYDFEVGGYAGFSDHTEGIAAALVAVAKGARVIEKHVTLDRTLPGPNHVASATFDELRRLVRWARMMERVAYPELVPAKGGTCG